MCSSTSSEFPGPRVPRACDRAKYCYCLYDSDAAVCYVTYVFEALLARRRMLYATLFASAFTLIFCSNLKRMCGLLLRKA